MSLKVVDPINVTDAVLTASDIPEPDTARGEVEWIPFEQKRFSEDFDPSTVGYSYVAAPVVFYNGNYYILVRSGGFPNFSWAIVEVDSEFTVLSTNSIQVASSTPNNLGFSLEEATGRITLFFGDLQGGIMQYASVSVNNIIPSPAFADISSVITTVFPGGVSGGVIFSLHGCESEGSFFFVARKDNDFKVHKFSVSATEIASKVTSSIETIYPDGNGGVYGFLTSTPTATDTTVKISRFDFQLSESQIGTIKSNQAWIASSVDASFSGGIFIQTSVNTGTGSANAKSFNETTLLNIGHYKNGDRVILTSNHTVYQCLSDTFDNPLIGATDDATATWIEVGPTNKWAMFDNLQNTKTLSDSDFTVTLNPVTYVNTLAVFGFSGVTSIRIEVDDSGGSNIYDKTFTASDFSAIYDHYTYVFYQIVALEKLIAEDLPPLPNTTIRVTFTGSNMQIGEIVHGFAINVGTLVAEGTKSDRFRYREQQYNEFGYPVGAAPIVVELNTYDVLVPKINNPAIQKLLDKVTGKNTLWVGDIGGGQRLITYGFFERSPIPFSMPNDINYQITVRASV